MAGDGISLSAHQAVNVGDAGLGGEVVHFVVQQNAGAGGDEPRVEGVAATRLPTRSRMQKWVAW